MTDDRTPEDDFPDGDLPEGNGSPDHSGGEALAGELALGLLTGTALATAEARLRDDPAFAERVAAWQGRLGALALEAAPATPRAAVWDALESRLFAAARPRRGLWDSLAFWRWLSAGAGALAAACVAALLLLPPLSGPPSGTAEGGRRLVASLQATDSGAAFLAGLDRETGRLSIRVLQASADPERVPELWLIPGDGVPRSLGVLAASGAGEIVIPEDLRAEAIAGATLAISLEPAGGAPGGQPTGPVIAAGALGAF